MSFISIEQSAKPKNRYGQVYWILNDSSFKEEFAVKQFSSWCTLYVQALEIYKKRKIPLAPNLALMTHAYFRNSAGSPRFSLDIFSNRISLIRASLITPEVLACARRILFQISN
jgi:hypothetical protein